MILLGFSINSTSAQNELYFKSGKTYRSLGLSGGFAFFVGAVELSLHNNRRISDNLIIEYKPLIGVIRQIYLFDGNGPRYTLGYVGGTGGILIGKNREYLNLSIGAGYYWSKNDPFNYGTNILPIGDISYVNYTSDIPYKIGLGIPKGISLTVGLSSY